MELPKNMLWRMAGGMSALALVAVGWAAWVLFLQGPPEPGPLLTKAWDKSINAGSYSFVSTSTLLVDGKQRVLSRLNGEIRQGDFHIKGEMVNTQVEMYQIGKKIYLRDVFDGNKWKTLEAAAIKERSLLDAEINPLAYLKSADFLQARLAGEQQYNQRTVYKLEVQPKVQNQFLDMLYGDFTATFLVGKWDKRIWQGRLEGMGKEKKADRIIIEITISNYDQVQPFQPPVKKAPL